MKNLEKQTNKFEVLRKICGKNFDVYFISNLKSIDLLKIWDYKKDGFNLVEAKKELIDCVKYRSEIKKYPKYYFPNNENKYLKLLEKKQKNIKFYLEKCENLEHVNQASKYYYGKWDCKRRSFILPNIKNSKYPIILTIDWDIDQDWNYYSKSYNRPKTSISNRKINFKTIGKLGNEEIIYTHNLNSFKGNFIIEAISHFLKNKKYKVLKELKKIQLNESFKIKKIKQLGNFQIYERCLGNMVWDFVIYNLITKESYHSFSKNNLVKGLKRKCEEIKNLENEIITFSQCLNFGFCEVGIKEFCFDNNIEFVEKIERCKLQDIVNNNLYLNKQKYSIELKKLKIKI